MTDQNDENSGIELDKLDLSSLGAPPGKEDKVMPEASDALTGSPERVDPISCEEAGSHSMHGIVVETAPERSRRAVYIAIAFILILPVLFFFMKSVGINLPFVGKEKTISNERILEIKRKSDALNKFMVNLNRSSGRSVDKGIVDINLENVEKSLVLLSEYNMAVSMFLKSKEAGRDLKVVENLYRSQAHVAYIKKLKVCLQRYGKLLKYRLKYHEEIVSGEQIKRMTYERLLLDYKVVVKQLKTKFLNLDFRMEKTAQETSHLPDLKDYYFIPDWSVFDASVKFID